MRIWIKQPLSVFSPGVDSAAFADGLVVHGGQVVEHVASGQQPSQPVDETFDAREHVLLPGLINTHHHYYQTLTRAIRAATNKPLFPWLTSLYPIWANLSEEMIDISTRLACAELLLSGCTTSADHHYVFSAETARAVDVQVLAARETGVRSVLTRGSMSLGQSAGGLPPDRVTQTEDEILADSERVIAAHHDPAAFAMTQIALAPCSPFSVTPRLMQDTAELAAQHKVMLHTHLAETQDENDFCLESLGQRPLDYIEECGWLRAGTWFAHGIHFTADEIDRIGKAGAAVSHCPSSNMFLGSGICPVESLQHAGALVGLGVDGSASNDASSLIQEVRQALLLQRLRAGLQGPEGLPAEQIYGWDAALGLATRGSADLLGRPELGGLQLGQAADLALFKMDEPRFSGAQDPLAALVLSGAVCADAVMVQGEFRVKHGQLCDTDLPALMDRHQTLAVELLAAAG